MTKQRAMQTLCEAVFLLTPLLGFGQKYLEPIILGVPRVIEDGAVKSLTQNALRPAVPALTGKFLTQAGVLPSLHFDDLNVNYLYSSKPSLPNRVVLEPVFYPEETTHLLGKNEVKLSPAAGLYEAQIMQHSLSEKLFPVSGPLDKDLTASAARNYAQQIDVIAALRNEFYASLHSELFQDFFPYERYLPSQKPDIIYLGVAHAPAVESDMVNWVRAIKRRYPTRNIYFATEYVWDTLVPSSAQEVAPVKILRNKQQLLLQMDAEEDYQQYHFLQDIIDEGIPVVGIEPTVALLAQVEKEAGLHLHDELLFVRFENLATSEVGMALRNKIWAEHIRQIRAQDDNALVVVCGGAQHVTYSVRNSLPYLLGDLKGVVILQVTRRGKEALNPILSQLEDRTYQQFMRRDARRVGPDSRYVLTLKSPQAGQGPSANLDYFRRAIGADVTVIVP